ncbi:MAG TPA: amidohydrolase family protein [Steroidobacteraceae bacterium]|nr:amidohydrolase family protein [Steroidobacteraceae bacterium]
MKAPRISGALPAVAAALATALSAQAVAQTPPAETVVLKAARIFDATGSALKDGGVVVVQGERIVSVGAANIPAGARVIDLGDATLLPGFIDAHTHVTMQFEKNYYLMRYHDLMRFPAEQVLYGALYARRTLEAGFTTVRNVGAGDFEDISLRNAINAGITEGPRMLVSAHGIGSPGGHFDEASYPPDRVHPEGPIQGICSGPEECRQAVRYQMKWGADVIKIAASGGVLSESDPVDVPQLTLEEMKAIISEAHAWRRKVAAHCHGDAAARLAIEAGVDSIEHGSFLTEDTLKLMKAKGVVLVPTRITVEWVLKEADTYPPVIAAKARAAAAAHGNMFKTALKVGVPIALGTDAGVYPHGMNGQEFGLYVNLGMTPAQALLSGTRDDAKLLGIDADVGTLEAGKVADVVAVPGNVISNIRATEHPILVMHLGRIWVHRSAAGDDIPEPRRAAAAAAGGEAPANAPAAAVGEFF